MDTFESYMEVAVSAQNTLLERDSQFITICETVFKDVISILPQEICGKNPYFERIFKKENKSFGNNQAFSVNFNIYGERELSKGARKSGTVVRLTGTGSIEQSRNPNDASDDGFYYLKYKLNTDSPIRGSHILKIDSHYFIFNNTVLPQHVREDEWQSMKRSNRYEDSLRGEHCNKSFERGEYIKLKKPEEVSKDIENLKKLMLSSIATQYVKKKSFMGQEDPKRINCTQVELSREEQISAILAMFEDPKLKRPENTAPKRLEAKYEN